MRVTTRSRYAICALYDLAFHRLGQAAQAKEIAARQRIPLRFLERILQDLRKAGIVEARRGPLEQMFGFERTKTPTKATDDIPGAVWTDVRARLVDVLEHATLQDFVTRAEAAGVKRAVLPPTMYFI